MLGKVSASVFVLALAAAMSMPAWAAEDQPDMQAALQHIQQAEQALSHAEHNKGGHRGKAMEHLRAAEAEIQAGIKYGDSHPEHAKKAGANQQH